MIIALVNNPFRCYLKAYKKINILCSTMFYSVSVCNQLIAGNIELTFSDENVSGSFFLLLVWTLRRPLVVAFGVPVGEFRCRLRQF